MNRSSKKGFTIVELIIVIAVIAVLAAVLIPTFSNLIQKANEAKDTALVSNLNKAVAMDTTNHDTMYDVLKVAEDVAGINVAKINAAANSNEILWDSVNKCFVYSVDGTIKYIPDTKTKDVEGDYDYWKISSNQKDIADGNYSIYWNGEALSKVTVKTGFDAGTAEVAEVNYDRQNESVGRKVTIRTNGGALTVNAPNDTVAHYYKASGVQITAVYGNSYHEHGEVVGDIVIAEGRIELAATAQVGTVLVASKKTGDVKVDVVSGAQVGTVAPTTEAAQEDVTKSTSIPTESKQTEVVIVNKDFAGGLGTERSPYLIASAEQFRNIDKMSTDMKAGTAKYFKLVSDIVLKRSGDRDYITDTFTGLLDGNGHSVTLDVASNSVVTGQESGYGTFWFCDNTLGETEIRDLTVLHTENSMLSIAIFCNNTHGKKVTLNNVDIGNESVVGSELEMFRNGSSYFYYADSDEITMVGCDNYYNMRSNDGGCRAALYVGSGIWRTKLTIKDSVNYGNLTAAYVGLVIGNPYAIKKESYRNITLDNVVNKGTITYFTSGSAIGGDINYNSTKDGFTIGVDSYDIVNKNYVEGTVTSAKDGSLALKYVDAEGKRTYTVTKAQNTAVVSYKVLVTAYASRYTGEVLNGTQRMPIYIDLETLSKITGEVYLYGKEEYSKKYNKEISSWKDYELMAGVKYTLDEENNAFVFDFSGVTNGMNYKLEAKASLYVCAYDSTNTLIALANDQ